MEHLAGVIDRIRTIESRIGADVPAGGFQRALEQVADTPAGTPPAAPTFSPFGGDAVAARPGGMSLAQMLGRPVTSAGSLHLPVDAPVSSGFGPRIHPVTGEHRVHAGIDLAAPTGTPIGATAAGTVTFAGVRGGYGNLVIIDHGDGTESRYAHQDTIAVTAGQRVGVGDLLGTVGSTGQSTGPHLHLEVRRDGQPVDPAPLLGLS